MFSWDVLRQALRFGLPRLPHGLAQQAMAVLDRYLLGLFAGLREVGLYSIGASFGLAIKLFLSAFEYAWAPFYYATMKERDAKDTFRLVTTYGMGVLVLLEAGLAATGARRRASDDDAGFLRRRARDSLDWAGRGLPGVLSAHVDWAEHHQGDPLLSRGHGHRGAHQSRGQPAAHPGFGAMGAAWMNACSYAVLAGAAYALSQRVYPVRHEYGRLARLIVAGVVAWLGAKAWPATASPLADFLVRGLTVLVAYPVLLAILGFYHRREIDGLARLVRARRAAPAPVIRRRRSRSPKSPSNRRGRFSRCRSRRTTAPTAR